MSDYFLLICHRLAKTNASSKCLLFL